MAPRKITLLCLRLHDLVDRQTHPSSFEKAELQIFSWRTLKTFYSGSSKKEDTIKRMRPFGNLLRTNCHDCRIKCIFVLFYPCLQMVTANFIPYSWDITGARVTTAVSSFTLKNSSGHLLNTKELNVTIKLQNLQIFINTSQSHYITANRSIFYKINVTQLGMALMLKIRPESNKTEFLVTVKYGERPLPSNSDLNVTIPDLSYCDDTPDGYLNCSRDPYMVFLNQEFVSENGLGFFFVGLKAVSRVSAISRVRRCSKRSCVQYKEPPTNGASYSVPHYREGDENYTIQLMPAACLFWNAEISQWTSEGCRVR